MRELTVIEIEKVSGGNSVGEYAADGGALGSIFGGLITGTINGALRGGIGGALVFATFGLSYNTTRYIMES